jgi:tRNA U54 and U55 pseudouridine synthase Pus10
MSSRNVTARQQNVLTWIRAQNSLPISPEVVARACRSEGFCGKCTLRYSLGKYSSSWSEWPGTDADESIHLALESFKKEIPIVADSSEVTRSTIEGDPWVPPAYGICPSCSGALQGRGQALIYTLPTTVEGGSSSVIQNEGFGGAGQGKISQDVIQMTAHRAKQEAEKLVNGFVSTGSKKRRRADDEGEEVGAQIAEGERANINLKHSHHEKVEWVESGLVGPMINHVPSTHWIDDLVRMISEGGYDLREGICVSIYPQQGLYDAEEAAYATLCKRLGVLKIPLGFKIPDIKELFRATVTQAVERIVYDTRSRDDALSTSMKTIINVPQSERVFEKAYKIQEDAEASSSSSQMTTRNAHDNPHSHMNQLIERLGGVCSDARALSVDVSKAVMLDRSLPLPSASNVGSVVISLPSSERLQNCISINNDNAELEATVDLNTTCVSLGTIETKTDHRQLFQSDPMGLTYIGGGTTSISSTLRRLTSTPGLSSLQLNVAIDSSPRGFLIQEEKDRINIAIPPRVAIVTTNIQRRSFFFKSRYCKYKRGLSQTPWFVEGSRKMGSSGAGTEASHDKGSNADGSSASSVINPPFTKLGFVEINEGTSVEELIGGPVAELVASFCGQGCAVGLLPDDTPPGSSSPPLNSMLPLDAKVQFFNSMESSSSSTEHVGVPISVKKVLPRYKFHAAGREDVDVRMLGPGRPYMIELIDSKPAVIPLSSIARAHEMLNQRAGGRLMTFPLSPASREESSRLSNGAESKRKSYSALVWSSAPHTREKLKELIDDKVHNLVVKQLTPIRVMHRRTLMTRAKKIHSASSLWISTHYFLLTLTTSAGTYVKEFVHGDLGRTRPNVGELLSAGAPLTSESGKRPPSARVVADILLLDVTDLVMTGGGNEGGEASEDDEEEDDSD